MNSDNENIQEELRKINDFNGFDETEEAEEIEEIEEAEEVEETKEIAEIAPVLTENKKMKYLPIHILAFTVPFILMLTAFYTVKIFPFGDRQIMVVDSWHQYYPFLQELQNKLQNWESLLYSWNTGAGTNFLTLIAYYASTPLYLFSVFVPQEYLREFMMIITVVKISSSGLFFSVYLRNIYINKQIEDKKYCPIHKGFAIIGFSSLYALSAYAAGYYWCVMWLDCMALLPLIILGLERFIEEGKYKLYVISLGLTVICDYYIAIFVCIFIALYYTVVYFSKTENPNFKKFINKTIKTIGLSVLGVGLAMFMLLPAYLWFGNTGNSGSTFSRDITTYNTLLDILTNLLPNTTPNQRAMAGLPNIACGFLSVIFAGLYFMNSKIKLREKFLTAGFLTFMLLCFNLNILDYFWHGMHFPNEIPYRQSFVFSFVLVTMAYKAYINFDAENINKNTVIKFCLSLFAFIIVAEQWYKSGDKFDFKVFYAAIAILAVYMAVLTLYKSGRISKNYFAVILMFAMIFESGMSAVKGASVNAPSERSSYAPSKENIQETIADIYESDNDKFFRLEMSRWFSTNDPALYGYRGISQFSSVANSRFARTLEILGIAATISSNRFLYSSATPVFNAFMSLKYIMARDETSQYTMNSTVFDEYLRNMTLDENNEETHAVTSYKNKYWLPLGFLVSDMINEVKINEQNIFITQNELMKKASGITGDVFKSIYQSSESNENLSESRGEYGVYSYSMTDPSKKGMVKHIYTNEKKQQVYIYLKSTRTPSSKAAEVSVNGEKKNYEINRGITIDCGNVLAGQDIKVNFEVDAGSSGSFYLFVVGFDEEEFKKGYDVLNTDTFDISDFKDTKIEGTLNARGDGIFFTSIPYDKGWNLKIDGKKVEINPLSAAEINDVPKETGDKKPDERQIKKITDGFVTAPVTAGEHTIELYYITEGLIPGAVISLLCAAVLTGLEIFKKKFKKQEG